MKIDQKTGRIAFHSIRFREDGGTDVVQYGFDGKIESITPRTLPPAPRQYSWWESLWLAP